MIQVIHRAFDIIEYIAQDSNKVYTLSEIADSLKLNHATCANIIKTMVHRNYVEQVGRKKGYRLGLMFYHIAGRNSYDQELMKASLDEMDKLTRKMNETSLLSILKKDLRVVLHDTHPNQDLMVKSATEQVAYNTASGRLLVAMLDDTQLKQFLEKYGLPPSEFWSEASTERTFKAEVEKIRKNGYATRTTKTHIVGIAVAILRSHETVASLGMYLPESRFNAKVMRVIVTQLRKTAQQISKNLLAKGVPLR